MEDSGQWKIIIFQRGVLFDSFLAPFIFSVPILNLAMEKNKIDKDCKAQKQRQKQKQTHKNKKNKHTKGKTPKKPQTKKTKLNPPQAWMLVAYLLYHFFQPKHFRHVESLTELWRLLPEHSHRVHKTFQVWEDRLYRNAPLPLGLFEKLFIIQMFLLAFYNTYNTINNATNNTHTIHENKATTIMMSAYSLHNKMYIYTKIKLK